jgi:hypothetical protein
MKRITLTVVLAVGLGILAGACAQADPTPATGTPADPTAGTTASLATVASESDRPDLDAVPVGEITGEEAAGLVWMREEEKLARDVYLALFDLWGTRIFSNIASSEDTHMEAVAELIDRYGLVDPVGDNPIGVFTDPALQGLYDDLVARGGESPAAALEVGAFIEELDIDDLRDRATDTADIDLVYANLEKGSRNHLRAFTKTLSNRGVDYQPTVLSIEDFEAIVSGETERGSA